MKHLWIAAAILFVLLGGTLGNSQYLTSIIGGYEQQLTRAQQLASRGDWDESERITRQVYADWEKHGFYFHSLLRHVDIDEILLTFHEVQEYLKLEESDQYNAANAKLITQLGLLAEMEQLTLKNIL
ncbi:MAG: DUF4363 family protein [Oscillospiraceae bacterium]|nr:DUF4363 family protein [Oscillospiraceae bacterium]